MSSDGTFLSLPYCELSTETDPLRRQTEQEIFDEEFIMPLYAIRGMKNASQNPYIRKSTILPARIFRSQPVIPNIKMIRSIFRPGSPGYNQLMDNAQDQEAVEEIRRIAYRAARDPKQWEVEMGSGDKMFSIFDSPALWARHGNWTPWMDILKQKMIVLVDTSMVSEEVARVLTIYWYCHIGNLCKKHFRETGKPLNVIIVLEEAGALGLVTPKLLTMLQEDRKCGTFVWVISQSIQDFDHE